MLLTKQMEETATINYAVTLTAPPIPEDTYQVRTAALY